MDGITVYTFAFQVNVCALVGDRAITQNLTDFLLLLLFSCPSFFDFLPIIVEQGNYKEP